MALENLTKKMPRMGGARIAPLTASTTPFPKIRRATTQASSRSRSTWTQAEVSSGVRNRRRSGCVERYESLR